MAISPRIIEIQRASPGQTGASGYSGYSGRSGTSGAPGGSSGYSGFSGTSTSSPFGVYNVLDYGAVADCVTLFDISMPNGSVVTSAGHTFVNGDIGKWAIIRGATSPGGRSPLIAKITSVSGNTATLDTATTTALTNLHAGTSFPRMDFGTDNAVPFDLATLAVPGPGNRNYYNSIPFTSGTTMNPILPGDGGTVYIPKGNYLLIAGYPSIPGTTYWWFEANNLTIKGDGVGQTNILTTTAIVSPLQGGNFTGAHGLFQNVTLSDFTIFDLNYYTGGGHNLMNIKQIDNLRVERVELANGKGNGCLNIQGVRSITRGIYIRDCWVHGNQSDGIATSIAQGIEGDGMNVGEVMDVHVERNRIEVPQRHAYEGGGLCYDQYFIGNTIDMGSFGLSGINPTGGNRTIVAFNNIYNVGNADNAACFAIDFTCDVGISHVCNDNIVIGNRCHGRGQGLIRFQNTSGDTTVNHINNFSIIGNQGVGTASGTGLVYLTGGAGAFDFPNAIISGNMFTGSGNLVRLNTGFSNGWQSDRRLVITNNIYNTTAGAIITANSVPYGYAIVENNVSSNSTLSNNYGGAGTTNFSGSVGPGTTQTQTKTMQGASPGDHSVVIVNGASWPAGLVSWGTVTATDTVVLYCYNPTGGALTAVQGKFYLKAAPQ